MKKVILYSVFSLLALVLIPFIALLAVLFFKPTLVINPQNLNWALEKSHILKSWSWKDARINHQWKRWNEREVSGHFKDLCFNFENDALSVSACFAEISWDFTLSYTLKEGFQNLSHVPFVIRGERSLIVLKDQPQKKTEETASSPPDLKAYWDLLWKPYLPKMDVWLPHNVARFGKRDLTFDLNLKKDATDLTVKTMGFTLEGKPHEMKLLAPKVYEIPYDLKVLPPLKLYDAVLSAKIKEEGIRALVEGSLELIQFKFRSFIDLPLKDGPGSVAFRKGALLKTSADITIQNIQENVKRFSRKPYGILPAPLNEMNGDIHVHITTEKAASPENILVKAVTDFDLESKKQALVLSLDSRVALGLTDFSPDSLLVGVDFKRVRLRLPRISKKSLPPQFLPDSRIKRNRKALMKDEVPASGAPDMTFRITAEGKKALSLSSNLLDEDLRLNFDLLVHEGNLEKGYIKVLPLNTTVFKRKIKIPFLEVTFRAPERPVIRGTVKFLLPEYRVTMKLEGPVSEPRFALSSKPPLPRSDIYSVLLFGRTMAELNPDDKTAVSKTNQLLANGVLSLSVLYFLSGSPVEYVGYDPDSKNATAQIGLSSKDSLRVGGGSEGVNSTGIRHSVGKGWYIDTSARSNKGTSQNGNATDYGVMLERIIAY